MSATPAQLDKLAKVLGLLGSSHDGEIIAAARAAEKIRVEAGVPWSSLLREVPDAADAAAIADVLARIAKMRAESEANAREWADRYEAKRADDARKRERDRINKIPPSAGWTKPPGSRKWEFTHPPKDWDMASHPLAHLVTHCGAALTPVEREWALFMSAKKGRPCDQAAIMMIRRKCADWWKAKQEESA